MENFFIYYLLSINIIGLFIMLVDKNKARHKQWRISEKTLIGISIVGGSIGILCGMHIFRHKTKHKKFTIGVPVILTFQVILLGLYIKNFLM